MAKMTRDEVTALIRSHGVGEVYQKNRLPFGAESVEQFLARGGKITEVTSAQNSNAYNFTISEKADVNAELVRKSIIKRAKARSTTGHVYISPVRDFFVFRKGGELHFKHAELHKVVEFRNEFLTARNIPIPD